MCGFDVVVAGQVPQVGVCAVIPWVVMRAALLLAGLVFAGLGIAVWAFGGLSLVVIGLLMAGAACLWRADEQ